MYKHYVYVFCLYSYQKNYPALSEYQVHLIVVYMLTLYCVFGVILPTSGCTLNILHLFNSNRFLHHFPCKYSKDSTLKYHQIKCGLYPVPLRSATHQPYNHSQCSFILLAFYIFWTLTYCFCANCRNYQFSKLF